jgi:hypothetical protein
VQSIVEVLAQQALVDGLIEIPVGGGDDPDVHTELDRAQIPVLIDDEDGRADHSPRVARVGSARQPNLGERRRRRVAGP